MQIKYKLYYNINMKNKHIYNITLTALFTALVIVGSRIYVGTHDTFRFHLGNCMCLLSAFLLSPVYAGLASGIGSMLFDILFYPFGLGCLVTFVTKFVMGYVAGIIFTKFTNPVFSGTIGEIAYIILYALKTYVERRYITGLPVEATIPILLGKVGASIVNAIVAIIVSNILFHMLSKLYKKNSF